MDAAQFRVSDRDRENTAALLRSAASEGRLTDTELDQRLGLLGASRFFGDLDALVIDLPVPPPSATVGSSAQPAPGHSPTDALRLSGGMSSDKRTGVWDVPRYIDISGGMGSVKMDCLQARCPHDVVNVHVSGGMGSVVIVVPEGWAANVDRIEKAWGSMKSKIGTVPAPGSPLLIITGSAGAGSVKVRHANWWDRRRLRKQGLELTTGTTQPAITSGQSTLPAPPLENDDRWTQENPELPNRDTLR